MSSMLALAHSGENLVNALIWIVGLGLICWLLIWFIDWCGLPAPFNKVAKVLVGLAAVIFLIRIIIRITGTDF